LEQQVSGVLKDAQKVDQAGHERNKILTWTEDRSAIGIGRSDRLAIYVSNIEGKADCPPNISHLCRRQRCDQ